MGARERRSQKKIRMAEKLEEYLKKKNSSGKEKRGLRMLILFLKYGLNLWASGSFAPWTPAKGLASRRGFMTSRFRMVPCTSQFCSFLWNSFLSYYLKTNKVKYIEIIYTFSGISQKNCISERSPKGVFFFSFFFCSDFILTRVKISLDKNHQKCTKPSIRLYMYLRHASSLLWIFFHFWKFWHFLLKKGSQKATFYHD